MGDVKDIIFLNETAFLPMSSASIRSLALSGLAGTPKKTVQFIAFKTRTKRIGEA